MNNNRGFAVVTMAFMAGLMALILVGSVQKQVQVFTQSLVRARLLTEAQFAVDALSVRIREAYFFASRKPHGVDYPTVPPYPKATYRKPANPLSPNEFHLVPSTGFATDVYIYNDGNQFCFDRPKNLTFGLLTDPICVNIPGDFLAQIESEQLSLKDYFVFFMHVINDLSSTPKAIAQINPSDPGTAGLNAASYLLAPNLGDPEFFADYVMQKCGPSVPATVPAINDAVDCLRFRFCLRRDQADCAAGVGNERYVIQTIVVNKTPRTVMGE